MLPLVLMTVVTSLTVPAASQQRIEMTEVDITGVPDFRADDATVLGVGLGTTFEEHGAFSPSLPEFDADRNAIGFGRHEDGNRHLQLFVRGQTQRHEGLPFPVHRESESAAALTTAAALT